MTEEHENKAVPENTAENAAAMDDAVRQLEAAIYRLEGRLDGLFSRLEGQRNQSREADALRRDRARLAGDLDAAKARERELQKLADEASEALGAAISEVREALGKV
jgi:predicted RNase H-like nuclease (RuvC/YqgF family)